MRRFWLVQTLKIRGCRLVESTLSAPAAPKQSVYVLGFFRPVNGMPGCDCDYPLVVDPGTGTGHARGCRLHFELNRALSSRPCSDEVLGPVIPGCTATPKQSVYVNGEFRPVVPGLAACNCRYPASIWAGPTVGLPTGHCPVCDLAMDIHRRWRVSFLGTFPEFLESICTPAPPPEPDYSWAWEALYPPEDRGTRYWVWVNGPFASFSKPGLGWFREALSVPIGWALAPDREDGVVLAGVFGTRWTALDVYELAGRGAEGFKLIGRD